MVRADYSNWVKKLKPVQYFRHAGKLGLKGPLSRRGAPFSLMNLPPVREGSKALPSTERMLIVFGNYGGPTIEGKRY